MKDREEFIKQRCEIDKITEEEFEKRYRVVKCNCGQPYCKGYRCLDLNDLLEENQGLKEQLSSNTLQLEELKKQVNKELYNTCLPYTTGYNKAIKDKEEATSIIFHYLCIDTNYFKNKYKSIIGDDINGTN